MCVSVCKDVVVCADTSIPEVKHVQLKAICIYSV